MDIKKISEVIGVKLMPCESSNIKAYGWSDNSLWVLFKRGLLYKYINRPEKDFWDLYEAKSIGKWVYNNLVKNKAPFISYTIKET